MQHKSQVCNCTLHCSKVCRSCTCTAAAAKGCDLMQMSAAAVPHFLILSGPPHSSNLSHHFPFYPIFPSIFYIIFSNLSCLFFFNFSSQLSYYLLIPFTLIFCTQFPYFCSHIPPLPPHLLYPKQFKCQKQRHGKSCIKICFDQPGAAPVC